MNQDGVSLMLGAQDQRIMHFLGRRAHSWSLTPDK